MTPDDDAEEALAYAGSLGAHGSDDSLMLGSISFGDIVNAPDAETMARMREEQKRAAEEHERRYEEERRRERADQQAREAAQLRAASLEAALRINPQGPASDVLADATSFAAFLKGA